MSEENLPRSPDPNGVHVITGWIWDALCDMVEAGQIHVGPGLNVSRGAGGTLLRLTATDQVHQLKITGAETGGGFYKGRTLIGSPVVADGLTNLTMPLGGENLAQADNALIVFLADNGTARHSLSAGDFGAGVLVGVTSEATPRKVFVWLTGAEAGLFPVTCATNTGSGGTCGAAATFNYDIKKLGQTNTLATNLSPEFVPYREAGVTYAAGTKGLAYFSSGSNVALWSVNEAFVSRHLYYIQKTYTCVAGSIVETTARVSVTCS